MAETKETKVENTEENAEVKEEVKVEEKTGRNCYAPIFLVVVVLFCSHYWSNCMNAQIFRAKTYCTTFMEPT